MDCCEAANKRDITLYGDYKYAPTIIKNGVDITGATITMTIYDDTGEVFLTFDNDSVGDSVITITDAENGTFTLYLAGSDVTNLVAQQVYSYQLKTLISGDTEPELIAWGGVVKCTGGGS